MSEPRYPYVAVDVAADEAEDAGARLFELGAQGVEERDATTMVKGGAAAGVTLVASFASHDQARDAAQALPSAWAARVEEVVGDAWRDEWKKHFEPFEVCPGIVVRPPWAPSRAAREIVLEPGRAFGTGLHETTSLVAGVLFDHASDFAGRGVLDVGCGSGILALVALALGAARARAIDVDPEAVAVTRENAERNAMADRVDADAADVGDVAQRYPVVVANIEAKTLVDLAAKIAARVSPGGLLVLSGILAPDVSASQQDDVVRAYERQRFVVLQIARKGEWIAISMRAWTR